MAGHPPLLTMAERATPHVLAQGASAEVMSARWRPDRDKERGLAVERSQAWKWRDGRVFNSSGDWDEVCLTCWGEAATFAVALFSLGAELGAAGRPRPERVGRRRPSCARESRRMSQRVRGSQRSISPRARARLSRFCRRTSTTRRSSTAGRTVATQEYRPKKSIAMRRPSAGFEVLTPRKGCRRFAALTLALRNGSPLAARRRCAEVHGGRAAFRGLRWPGA